MKLMHLAIIRTHFNIRKKYLFSEIIYNIIALVSLDKVLIVVSWSSNVE